jgi:hypothetical protein
MCDRFAVLSAPAGAPLCQTRALAPPLETTGQAGLIRGKSRHWLAKCLDCAFVFHDQVLLFFVACPTMIKNRTQCFDLLVVLLKGMREPQVLEQRNLGHLLEE